MRAHALSLLVRLAAPFFLAWQVGAQCQATKCVGNPPAAGEQFGSCTAIDGDWMLVGVPSDHAAPARGSVYAFHRTSGIWGYAQTLAPNSNPAATQFGASVAILGDTAVIGAPNSNTVGSVYVFALVGGAWVQQQRLTPASTANVSLFGTAVALSSSAIVVGSGWSSPLGVSQSGELWVFEHPGSTWVQVADLHATTPANDARLGNSVAIDGNWIVAGASNQAVAGMSGRGAAYVFGRTGGVWSQFQGLADGAGTSGDTYGQSVSIFGNTMAVGIARLGNNAAAGQTQILDFVNGTWAPSSTVTGEDALPGDHFGSWVALKGNVLAVASEQHSEFGFNCGSAYIFSHGPTGWTQTGEAIPNDVTPNKGFGIGLSLSGATLALGAPHDNGFCPSSPSCESGAAYIFDLGVTSSQYGSCASGAPCMNAVAHGGCANSTGHGAVLAGSGSGSVSADDVLLQARGLPPGAACLFYMGGGFTMGTFGNGQRVVLPGATGIFRLGVQHADVDGFVQRGPGLVAQSQGFSVAGHILAGQTRYLQCWYRNAVPPAPCLSTFNLSNGLRVDFVP